MTAPRSALARRVAFGVPGVAAAAAAAATAWQAWRLRAALRSARSLTARTEAFACRPEGARRRVLVLGDSTAVGVGAETADSSLAGRLSQAYPEVELVNAAVSGARVADALDQARARVAAGESFDLVLLCVGGNDVFRMTPRRQLKAHTRELLQRMQTLAPQRVWLGSADIGSAPVFVGPFAWWLGQRTQATAALFAREARRHGVLFLDFADAELAPALDDATGAWFAADGVHPSARSYAHCFEVLECRAALAELLAGGAAAGTEGAPPCRPLPRS